MRTNANALAKKNLGRIRALEAASRLGLTRAVAAVDRRHVVNLSGSNQAEPGSSPVPNRTGQLMGAHGFGLQSATRAVAFNEAGHALSVHEGRGSNTKHGKRRFLTDAVTQTPWQKIYVDVVTEGLK